jgi:transcriptional repressor NrdR
MSQCQELVNDVLAALYQKQEREIESEEIGEIIMNGLKKLDQVAYVRFASVYRAFKDVSDFRQFIEPSESNQKRKTLVDD